MYNVNMISDYQINKKGFTSMKNYNKPIAVVLENIAEGIYAASGDVNCYTVTAHIHQKPEIGRGDYRIQVNGAHAATDNHHSGEQILTLHFNQAVTYSDSNGQYITGNGTNVIQIKYNYHNNGIDNIGLGDVIVISNSGLDVISASLACNHNCNQH